MTYCIAYSKAARKALSRLPRPLAQRIREKIQELALNPRAEHLDVVKLQGRPGYRLRVGNHRVIYELKHDQLVIVVVHIGARGSVYVQDSDDQHQWRAGGRASDQDLRASG